MSFKAVGLTFSWAAVTSVLLIDSAVLYLAASRPDVIGWVLTAVAGLIVVVGLVTYHRMPLAAMVVGWIRDRRAAADPEFGSGRITAIDHRHRYGRDVVGIRAGGGQLVSVIVVMATREAAELPIDGAWAGLRQFDVRLAGIDIVAVSERDRPEPTTWVVLRWDPQRNIAAVVPRDSVAGTFAAATERLAEHLCGSGRTARILDAGEITDLDGTLLGGLRTGHLRVRLNRIEVGTPDSSDLDVTSDWVAPENITSALLRRVAATDADLTVLTLMLTPGDCGVRVSAMVRHHRRNAAPGASLPGCQRLAGRQWAAIMASRPVPWRHPFVVVPDRGLGTGEQLTLPLKTPLELG